MGRYRGNAYHHSWLAKEVGGAPNWVILLLAIVGAGVAAIIASPW